MVARLFETFEKNEVMKSVPALSRSPWSWVPTLYLAEGIPYVGEVGSDPIPVNIVKVANDETVTVQLLAGEKKQIMLKEINKDGERLLLVQPVGANSAMQFTDSSLEYLTLNQVAQSSKDLKQ